MQPRHWQSTGTVMPIWFQFIGNVDEHHKGGRLQIEFSYEDAEDAIYATVTEKGLADYSDSYVLYKD